MDCNLQRLVSAETEVVTTIEIPYREEGKKTTRTNRKKCFPKQALANLFLWGLQHVGKEKRE